ncbi:MAG: flavohemoprotein [Streptomyces sp.]|jgi:ferredoxin-NADP reductase/hemoglobin-like flavoprotein|nr:flavohemoprotein [Streptomyces sp.]
MSLDPALIHQSFATVERRAEQASRYFYTHLFHHNPGVRAMFPEQMDEQRDRLFMALGHAAKHVADTDALVTYLRGLGFDHRKFGARPEHYPAVGRSLLATLAFFCGEAWTPQVEASWVAAYGVVTEVMTAAAAEADAAGLPEYWDADVVAHERRSPDIAVVTVRPRLPYPFRAGQFLTVTAPQVPQVWRSYTIANAPRRDNTLDLHIRRVPGGLLSGALVDGLRVGDQVRLGPPRGEVGLVGDGSAGLLCVVGGTGWATAKALVDQMSRMPGGRPVRVVMSARSAEDLYDLGELEILAKEYPWLELDVVVPDSVFEDRTRAALLDRVRASRDVFERQIVLSGPGGMIDTVRDLLHGLGVPAQAVHYDAIAHSVHADRPSRAAEWFLMDHDIPWVNGANRPGA